MSFLHFLAKFKNIFTISCMSPTLFSSFNGINSLPSHKHNLKIHLFPWAILNSFWPHKTYFNSSILPFLIFSGISFFYYLSHPVLFFFIFLTIVTPHSDLKLNLFPFNNLQIGPCAYRNFAPSDITHTCNLLSHEKTLMSTSFHKKINWLHGLIFRILQIYPVTHFLHFSPRF